VRRAILIFFIMLAGWAAPPRGEAARLTVSAAISLKEVFRKIAKEFEARHPEHRVSLNLGSSGHLQRQIELGAPVDVFATAALFPMEALGRANLLQPGTRKVFATNRLSLVRPRGSGAVDGFSVLGKGFQGRLVIGNPRHVPAGVYAKQTLVALGYWKGLSASLILAEHVRQVLDYVVRGEVDAGIVYRTDALREKGRVDRVAEAPPGSHAPIAYPIAVIAETRYPREALRFVNFVLGGASRAILSRAGFGPADPP
jgi:molybdate transport system substrate-binding protein